MQEDIPIKPLPTRYERLRQFWKNARELVETVLLAVLLYLVINLATSRIQVQSVSMQPTLYERDRVLVNRLKYRFDPPQRQDIIVFMPPLEHVKEPYIKRVIGLPGDTLRIAAGQVYVNGEALEETYLRAAPDYSGEWQVPEGSLFVLGDNRNLSSDSHFWGTVPVANVIGKAEFIYWPLWRISSLYPGSSAAASGKSP